MASLKGIVQSIVTIVLIILLLYSLSTRKYEAKTLTTEDVSSVLLFIFFLAYFGYRLLYRKSEKDMDHLFNYQLAVHAGRRMKQAIENPVGQVIFIAVNTVILLFYRPRPLENLSNMLIYLTLIVAFTLCTLCYAFGERLNLERYRDDVFVIMILSSMMLVMMDFSIFLDDLKEAIVFLVRLAG